MSNMFDIPQPFKKYPSDATIWNQAVVATLRELRKYDGIISLGDREMLTAAISKKVFKKRYKHNFKPLQY